MHAPRKAIIRGPDWIMATTREMFWKPPCGRPGFRCGESENARDCDDAAVGRNHGQWTFLGRAMTPRQKLVLLFIAAATFLIDAAWRAGQHFNVDLPGFIYPIIPAMIFLCLGLVADIFGRRSSVDATLTGLAFMLIFSPCC